MKKYLISLCTLLICVALLFALCGCGGTQNNAVSTETGDIAGNSDMSDTSTAPQRVVVLQASLADVWLLSGGTVVGVTDDIEEHGLELPNATVIGTTKAPSTELILTLNPDLVIYTPDITGQQAAAETLQQAGIPVLAAKIDGFEDYLACLKQFSEMNGNPSAYETYGTAVQNEIEQIIASVPSTVAGFNPPTVLFLRAYSSGVKAKASEHIVCDMLSDLQAVNIAAKSESLLENLSMEVILADNPDEILIVTMGDDEEQIAQNLEQTLFSQPGWQSLTAVQNGHVHMLPRELFHYKPNARWAEAYRYLEELLYEEAE